MSAPPPALQSYLLEKLKAADGQKLTGSKLEAPAGARKRLGVDESHVRDALAFLVEGGQVEEKSSGRSRSYRLTPSGRSYLDTLGPAQPPLKESLFPYQKAFVLLQFFKAPGGRLTPEALARKLVGDEVVGYLEFVPMDQAAEAPAKDRRPDPALLEWILHTLTRDGVLERREARGLLSYAITEPGEERLWAMDQYPSIRIQLHLKGDRLNRVLQMIRKGGGASAEAPQPATPTTDGAPPRSVDGVPPGPVSVDRPPTLSPAVVMETVEELLRERFARIAKVPIYELRAVLAERLGDEAATHSSLDPLLMRLDREDRIRLIAIGDQSRATSQQLDDSIPGESEIFFQIEMNNGHGDH